MKRAMLGILAALAFTGCAHLGADAHLWAGAICSASASCPGHPNYYEAQQLQELQRLNHNLERQAARRR